MKTNRFDNFITKLFACIIRYALVIIVVCLLVAEVINIKQAVEIKNLREEVAELTNTVHTMELVNAGTEQEIKDLNEEISNIPNITLSVSENGDSVITDGEIEITVPSL